jgi:hypothetical protein
MAGFLGFNWDKKTAPGLSKGRRASRGQKYPAGETGIGTVLGGRTDYFQLKLLNKIPCKSSIFSIPVDKG